MQAQQQLLRRALVAVVMIGAFIASATLAFADTSSSTEATSTQSFSAFLSPNQEVPSVTSTTTGNITVRSHGNTLDYSLNVFNGENITDAHLHCGSVGENGPVVVSLFDAGSGSSSVNVNGNLVSGSIAENNTTASTSVDCASVIGYSVQSIDDLRQALQNEDIYANIHSLAHPAGTARGQLVESDGGGQGGSGNADDNYDHSTSTDDGYGSDHWDDNNYDDSNTNEHEEWNSDNGDSGQYWNASYSSASSSYDGSEDCDHDNDDDSSDQWDNNDY